MKILQFSFVWIRMIPYIMFMGYQVMKPLPVHLFLRKLLNSTVFTLPKTRKIFLTIKVAKQCLTFYYFYKTNFPFIFQYVQLHFSSYSSYSQENMLFQWAGGQRPATCHFHRPIWSHLLWGNVHLKQLLQTASIGQGFSESSAANHWLLSNCLKTLPRDI